MPTRHGTDALATGIALRDNRGLHFRWPIPPLARAREHLEPLRALAHRIITRDCHSSNALQPDQGPENQRCASTARGNNGWMQTRVDPERDARPLPEMRRSQDGSEPTIFDPDHQQKDTQV